VALASSNLPLLRREREKVVGQQQLPAQEWIQLLPLALHPLLTGTSELPKELLPEAALTVLDNC
jgi:hypothetical protein